MSFSFDGIYILLLKFSRKKWHKPQIVFINQCSNDKRDMGKIAIANWAIIMGSLTARLLGNIRKVEVIWGDVGPDYH